MFEEGKHNSCLQGFYGVAKLGAEQCLKAATKEPPKCRDALQLVAVTDAASCPRSLVEQVERIAICSHKPHKLLLRAKELDVREYAALAQQLLPICQSNGIELIIHSHWQVAQELALRHLHMPLPLLGQMPAEAKAFFSAANVSITSKEAYNSINEPWLSTSVHSVTEAEQALKLGANALIAGHIYATNCKAGLPPRGLEFLQSICACVRQKQAEAMGKATWLAEAQVPSQAIPQAIPVYAIGGIGFDEKQWQELRDSGACGACIMSAYMKI